jgi:hypothetical protein
LNSETGSVTFDGYGNAMRKAVKYINNHLFDITFYQNLAGCAKNYHHNYYH